MAGNLIEKSLKRYLKRKVKITLGLITAFLITGAVSFSAITIKYDENDNKIKIFDKNGNDVTLSKTYGEVKGNTWINNSSINDEIIINESILENVGNIKLNVENNGIIKAIDSNGITITCTTSNGVMGDIKNNGIILGNSINDNKNTGNGIEFFNFDNISKESGIITLNNISNNGIISGYSAIEHKESSGNGISIFNYSCNDSGTITLNNINNSGVILGEITNTEKINANKGNGIGIFNWSSAGKGTITVKGNISNTGIIQGKSSEGIIIDGQANNVNKSNGIGIYNFVDYDTKGVLTLEGKIVNNGILIGDDNVKFQIGSNKTEANSSKGNGLGIYNGNSGELNLNNEIINNGIMNGHTTDHVSSKTSKGNGMGIYNHEKSDSITLNSIINNGMMNGNTRIEYESNESYRGYSSKGNGLGIYARNPINLTDDIINNGTLAGQAELKLNSRSMNEGNGLGIYAFREVTTNEIVNRGVATGYVIGTLNYNSSAGNGLSLYKKVTLKNIINKGLVIGSEHGIYLKDVTINNGKYHNYGVIGGKTAVDINGNDGISENSGLYLTFNDNHEVTAIERAENGKAAIENFYIVNAVKENENSTKTIESITMDTEKELDGYRDEKGKYHDLILNGVNNTLTVNQDTILKDSIINAYENAVLLTGEEFTGNNVIINGGGLRIKDENGNNIEQNIAVTGLENDDKFTLKGNSVLNGDIVMGSGIDTLSFENDTKVNGNINGEEGNDIFTFKDNSVLNGNVAMGEGDDTVSFDSKVQINGNLDGGTNTDADTKDTLNLGINSASDRGTLDKTFDNSLKIYDSVISGFENINIKDNVTVFETAKIKDAETLTIEKGNQLNLRIDGTKKDEQTGNIIGHALYENNSNLTITGTIDNSKNEEIKENESGTNYEKTGILNLVTSGLGVNSVISFKGIKFDTVSTEEPNGTWTETGNLWVKTDNLLDNVVINNDETITIDGEKDIFKIIAKVTPPDPVDPTDPSDTSGKLYEKLNDIYKGAYSSGDENFIEIKNIITNTGIKGDGDYTEVTEEQQLKTLLAYLKEIYTNSLYSFTSDASRKSMGMFRDAVRENNFKALDDEWIIYGGFTHIDGNREQTYYGRNYHKFDTGSYDNNADVKMTGAYAQAEYGLDNTLSAGILFGGNKSDIEVSNSKADGNSMYLGGYIKKDIKDFRITAGAGMQYSEYDAERNMSNRKYDDKYSDNAFDIYVNGKYFYEISDNLYFEPYGQLAYTYVDQEGINENDGALSLNIKDKDFTFIEGTIGADLRKEIIKDDIKHNFKGGISYTRLLDGYKEDNLTADFGGNSFDILVPHKTPDELKIGVRYELERTNGLMFSVNADYLISMDSKDNGHKNENENEWRIGAGFGYRFN